PRRDLGAAGARPPDRGRRPPLEDLMTASLPDISIAVGRQIPLEKIEAELASLLNALKDTGEGPIQRARMSNLMIFFTTPQQVEAVSAQLPVVLASHPCRVLLLVADPHAKGNMLTSSCTA